MNIILLLILGTLLTVASPIITMAPYPALPAERRVELWASLDAERDAYEGTPFVWTLNGSEVPISQGLVHDGWNIC